MAAAGRFVSCSEWWTQGRPAPTATRVVTPLLPFQQRPLIRLSGGSVLPLSYRLLMEKASTGAYWVLHAKTRL